MSFLNVGLKTLQQFMLELRLLKQLLLGRDTNRDSKVNLPSVCPSQIEWHSIACMMCLLSFCYLFGFVILYVCLSDNWSLIWQIAEAVIPFHTNFWKQSLHGFFYIGIGLLSIRHWWLFAFLINIVTSTIESTFALGKSAEDISPILIGSPVL